MAAYAATISSSMDRAVEMSRGIAIYAGTAALTNYNSTLVALTALTQKFDTVFSVTPAVSTNGYRLNWVSASSAFKAWKNSGTAGVDVEVGDDVDVGTFQFIATGLRKSAG